MPARPHFTPKLFQFLRELKRNNERDWFEANKARFQEDVRDPMLAFIADLAPRLEKVSPHFVADPRPSGGSLFRIYRDIRFAKDKSPYKTHVAAQFRHERGKNVHAPGYYLHVEPGGVFAGAGIWRADSKALGRIRDCIVEKPADWKRITRSKAFQAFEPHGESLQRPPRGYDPEHPFVDDLRRKDHVVTLAFTEKQACQAGFLGEYLKFCRATSRYVQFLTEALGLEF